MQIKHPTIVLRHQRENLKKCSLRGLESREDFKFFTYPRAQLPPLDGYVILVMDDAPELSLSDADRGLFIVDATWRYARVMMAQIAPATERCVRRTLPSHYRTAYPRRQDDCPDPERGLASVEAIYIAYHLMGYDTAGLLDHYYWRDVFLEGLR